MKSHNFSFQAWPLRPNPSTMSNSTMSSRCTKVETNNTHQHALLASAGPKEELRHVSVCVCVSTFSILLEGFRRFHSVYATTFPADVSSMYASLSQAPEASPHRQHQPNQRRPRRTKAEAWNGHWNGRWTGEHRVQTDKRRWWMDWCINLIHAQGESQETIECCSFDTRVHAWARHVLLQVAPKNLQAVGGICSRVADCRLSRWCWILRKLSFFLDQYLTSILCPGMSQCRMRSGFLWVSKQSVGKPMTSDRNQTAACYMLEGSCYAFFSYKYLPKASEHGEKEKIRSALLRPKLHVLLTRLKSYRPR